MSQSQIVAVPEGSVLFGPGNAPENMVFLLNGTVRVSQMSDTGHEITLYRIDAGQSCVLTTVCLLSYDDYSATGIAETAVQAAAIPRSMFDDLVAQSKPFRDLVFAAFAKRITDLFLMIDEIAFQRLDVRLADKLVKFSGGENSVATTHQKLAIEPGTARGSFVLVEPAQLRQLAKHNT